MPIINCPIEDCKWKSDNLDNALAVILGQQLQMHEKAVHTACTQVNSQKLKIDPPKMGVGASPEDWESFKRQWSMFKTGTNVPQHQVSIALFHCCSEGLKQDIMRDVQFDIGTMSETDLLGEIKRLAVKEESILVHRMKLGKMAQTPGMGIRTFLANLRGQASLCQFTTKCTEPECTHTFNYSKEIIKDTLIRGISDPEILADILGDAKTDRTLEEVVSFIAQKEQGKATRTAVGDCAAAMGNNWDQGRNQNIKDRLFQNRRPEPQNKCWACGGPSHGPKNDRATRTRKCPAWTATCNKCNVKGHYNKCCSKCNTCESWGHRDSNSRWCKKGPQTTERNNQRSYQMEDESFNLSQLAIIQETPSIDHHIFENKWISRPSKPHPTIEAEINPLPEEHAQLGNEIPTSILKSTTITMIADSGCQSSIIPLDTAQAMGYKTKDIMPVNLNMRGAISEDLGVEGGIIVQICVRDIEGQPRTCKQLVYLSEKIKKAFLCREALEQLAILPPNFPDINTDHTMNMSIEPSENICSCPKREPNPPPKPTCLPTDIDNKEEDIPALKQWLLEYYGSSTFNVCEHQPLPMMTGEPLQLYTNPNAKPVAVHKPATVPKHWQDKVFADLERDVTLGVLEKVEPNTPVTWCSRMVVTAKADGTPRRTVDLQPLNKQSVRQTHHVSAPFRLAEQIPQNKKKTVTDAWNGYHSIPICEEDRHLTTFITPWGRYRYKVAPQGFLASGDGYTQRFDSIISDFPNKVKCVDDTCMWADTIEEAFFQTCEWLDICARNGITLNPKKFQFAQDTIDFAGLTVTKENIKPNQKFLDSILQFPTPKDISGARAWFGLVNQGAYAFAMAKEMKPFRDLLKPSNKFYWTEDLALSFVKSKQTMINAMKDGVRLYTLSKPTCIATDWSQEGIGFTLKQKYCKCSTVDPTCCKTGWHLCLVGSRFTTPTESRYAPVEGEALAVAYALHQTRYYILGCPDLIVTTDHKPLVSILNGRSLTEITNRRLLNLKEKTLPYNFEIKHVPGTKNKGPDALSRYPPTVEETESENMADDIGMKTEAISTLFVASNIITWNMVKTETAEDPTLKAVKEMITKGPADIKDLHQNVKPYHRYFSHLYVVDGVIMIGQRIIIPQSLRHQLLQTLHAAHQGVGAMSQRAADSMFWPGISIDITRTRNECEHCHRMAKSNAMEPPPEIIQPDYPFQQLCSDYFSYNNGNYLVMVDRYSNWPIVFKENGKAEQLIKRLRDVFITFGIPEELTSDGGPQFTADETQRFLESWGVRHRRSSVANPHANSRAEIAVKTVKRMLMANTSPTGSLDVDSFQRAMLIYRNSIDPETKTSPAMIIFGHQIRDPIPTPIGKYCPHPTWQETMDNREKALAKRHNREREKWSEHTKELQPLEKGDNVYIQNMTGNNPLRWERTGIILEVKPFKQYLVKVDGTGRTTLRNRKNLRKFTPFRTPEKIVTYYNHKEPLTPHSPPTKPVATDKTPDATENIVPYQGDTPPATPGADIPEVEIPLEPITQEEKPKKMKLALRRLLPHNKPGTQED